MKVKIFYCHNYLRDGSEINDWLAKTKPNIKFILQSEEEESITISVWYEEAE